MIYFLLTTNFLVDEGVGVKLPQAAAAKSTMDTDITVVVDGQGRIFMEDRQVQPETLLALLRARIEEATDKLVIVKADRSVELDKAVRVMDTAKLAGAGRLCLATEKPYGP